MLTGWNIMAVVASGMIFCASGYSAEAAGTNPAPAAVTATPAAQPAETGDDNPGPQPFQGTGVVLINPSQLAEAKLLVQIMIPGADGVARPEVIGLAIKADDNGAKLIKDFGIKAVKPEDKEGAKKAQTEAMQKIVKVDGVLSFANDGPVLTVSKFEKCNAVPEQEAHPAGAAATPPATPAAANR